jgi:hypothetical protein
MIAEEVIQVIDGTLDDIENFDEDCVGALGVFQE